MDAVKPREGLISILNDNDSPSFAVRPKRPSSIDLTSKKQERPRPQLTRQPDWSSHRQATYSAPETPPLLRLDSTSSKASSSTMDSPSPKTPVYNYDPQLISQAETWTRQDLSAYLPSPSGITPLLDTMMIVPAAQDPLHTYNAKSLDRVMSSQFPLPLSPVETQQLAAPVTPAPQTLPPTPTTASNATPKKNKYPCPYASSHHCTATFTTSGHAARHGKKHTGEKGVHCPICDKAFTRKDNMKQHERTHKGSISGSVSDDPSVRRSKAAVTKDAARASKKINPESNLSNSTNGLIHSPLSEVASIDPSVIGTPSISDDHGRFNEEAVVSNSDVSHHVSAYPPLGDDSGFGNLVQLDRNMAAVMSGPAGTQVPISRTYNDLDTLAMAAAYDPYSHGNTT